jgi:hypothetical protein
MQLGPLIGQVLVFCADAGITEDHPASYQIERPDVVFVSHRSMSQVLVAGIMHCATKTCDNLAPEKASRVAVSHNLGYMRQA